MVYNCTKENSYYKLIYYLESQGCSTSYNNYNSEPKGFDLRQTGLDVNPVIATILGLDSHLYKM